MINLIKSDSILYMPSLITYLIFIYSSGTKNGKRNSNFMRNKINQILNKPVLRIKFRDDITALKLQ